jgi:hypothetical protein
MNNFINFCVILICTILFLPIESQSIGLFNAPTIFIMHILLTTLLVVLLGFKILIKKDNK